MARLQVAGTEIDRVGTQAAGPPGGWNEARKKGADWLPVPPRSRADRPS